MKIPLPLLFLLFLLGLVVFGFIVYFALLFMSRNKPLIKILLKYNKKTLQTMIPSYDFISNKNVVFLHVNVLLDNYRFIPMDSSQILDVKREVSISSLISRKYNIFESDKEVGSIIYDINGTEIMPNIKATIENTTISVSGNINKIIQFLGANNKVLAKIQKNSDNMYVLSIYSELTKNESMLVFLVSPTLYK